MPEIDEVNRKKPLCYDPKRHKFIFYNEIVDKIEDIILPSTLSKSDQKKLIIERQISGPDYKSQAMSGPAMNRNDFVKAIQNDEENGVIMVEAEISYLDELLEEIRQNL